MKNLHKLVSLAIWSVLLIIVAAVLAAFFDEWQSCANSGGTLVRTAVWFACINN